MEGGTDYTCPRCNRVVHRLFGPDAFQHRVHPVAAGQRQHAFRGFAATLGDDLGEVVGLLKPWGEKMRESGGYIAGPVDLWPDRDD